MKHMVVKIDCLKHLTKSNQKNQYKKLKQETSQTLKLNSANRTLKLLKQETTKTLKLNSANSTQQKWNKKKVKIEIDFMQIQNTQKPHNKSTHIETIEKNKNIHVRNHANTMKK